MDQETKIEELAISQEELDQKEMQKDACPVCLTPTAKFSYLNGIPPLGWLECNFCGAVFCPNSIRKKKLEGPSRIIKPNIIIP